MRRLATLLIALTFLGACSTLPEDGPTADAVAKGANARGGYAVIDLDYRVAETIAAHPDHPLANLGTAASEAPVDRIGAGDQLTLTIVDAGATAGPGGEPPGPRTFANLAVGADGRIEAPYAGSVEVAGLAPDAAARRIRQALAGKMISPQVAVTVSANVANAVTVIGEVKNAGRYPLTMNNDRLMDIIAAAGGPTRPAPDVAVSIVRGERTATAPLSVLLADATQDVRLAPRDQVRLTHHPRKFSTFGAFAKAAQVSIEDDSLTLAGAISRMGGLDTNAADARAVLVFRFESAEAARALGVAATDDPRGTPVVYRLNLRDPQGYFVANRFAVKADDLIYVPRADVTELKKFFDLVGSITRVIYDVTAAGRLP